MSKIALEIANKGKHQIKVMKTFERITKKAFCDRLSSEQSILVYGGYSKKDFIGTQSGLVLDVCHNIDKGNSVRRIATIKSNRIEFTSPTGEKGYYYFDDNGTHTYWQYKNILIAKNHVVQKANDRCSYDIDMTYYCIYLCV